MYDDEEFLEILDLPNNDEWIGTAVIARLIGCQMATVNHRLLALARETDIEVYDPAVGDGERVAPESFDTAPRRQLGFRRTPDDPEHAPASLDTGYAHVDSAILLLAEATTPCTTDDV